MTVFVPLTLAAAQALRATGRAHDLRGYADGPGLRRWLGQPSLDREEADYVALGHAGVAALTLADVEAADAGTRLVLAVDAEGVGADDLGAVRLASVGWRDVGAVFADEEAAAGLVRAAREAVRGLELAEALPTPAVVELESAHDLLWYAPTELDALAAVADAGRPDRAD